VVAHRLGRFNADGSRARAGAREAAFYAAVAMRSRLAGTTTTGRFSRLSAP
jgi:hypothetical protein